jgi:epoxyqueuosine reductase
MDNKPFERFGMGQNERRDALVRITKLERERLAKDPNLFLERTIKKYVADNPENRLPMYRNEPLTDHPLVGFADGYDPIFQDFKDRTIIGEFHFTPEEALSTYLKRQHKNIKVKTPSSISVISIVFTATQKTRLSNYRESVMSSPRWQYAFGRGMRLMENTLEYLALLLETLGHQAVAPVNTKPAFFLWQIPDGPTADWSEKHIAYAAGLGTFGLNSGLITPQGAALHCGSVITDLAITPTPRSHDNYLANCLYYRNGSCQRCVQRCPSGALSKQGYNSIKCFFYHEVELPRICKDLGREPERGGHPVCSLCQTDVPCERRIPRACKSL